LAAQIAPIHQAVAAMGWKVIAVPGIEADDIIGTLACQAEAQGVHTIISTGDKDIAQLVTEHVELVNTMNGERLDVQGVIEKFGVAPSQIVDYLMLVGDAVDNVPGVPKVGPKTAVKWLTEYGSIEGLIQNADRIKGVAGENLRNTIPTFPLTRQLITIKIDCELDFNGGLESLVPREPDRDTLIKLFEEYGFRTWLRELTGDDARVPEQDARVAAAPPPPPPTEYETILDEAGLDRLMARLQGAELVAMDTETTSLDPMVARLVGMSFATAGGVACYVPVAHRGPDVVQQLPRELVIERLRAWLESADSPKLLHNAKYDAHVMANEGVRLAGITEDTMLQAYVLESHRRVNLQELGERWLGRTGVLYEDICGKGAKQICFDEVAIEDASRYAC